MRSNAQHPLSKHNEIRFTHFVIPSSLFKIQNTTFPLNSLIYTFVFLKVSAANSGSTVLISRPVDNSKPAQVESLG